MSGSKGGRSVRRKVLSLFLCLCLLAAFLPAGVMAVPAEEAEPGLNFCYLNWNQDDGWYPSEDYIRPYYMSFVVKNAVSMQFSYVEAPGAAPRALSIDELTFSSGIEAVQLSDTDPTLIAITLTTLDTESITYSDGSLGGADNVIQITGELPLFGCYSTESADLASCYGNEIVRDSDRLSFYIAASDPYDRVYSVSCDAVGVEITCDETTPYASVVLTEQFDRTYVSFNVTGMGGRTYFVGVNIVDVRPQLVWRWAKWDSETGAYVSNTEQEFNTYFGNWSPDGYTRILEFYYDDRSGNDPVFVPYDQLTITGDCVTVAPEGDFVRLVVDDFGDFTFRYNGASGTFHSILPTLGYYDKPVAAEENYLKRWTCTGSDTIYLVPRSGWSLSNVKEDSSLGAQITTAEDGSYTAVQLPDPASGYLYLTGTITDEYGNSYSGRGASIYVTDIRPGLVWRWAGYDQETQQPVPDPNAQIMRSISGSPSKIYSSTREFLLLGADGSLTTLSAADLSVSGGFIELKESVNGLTNVRFTDFGQGEITYQGYSIPVEMVLPEGGLFSAPEMSEETFIGMDPIYDGAPMTLYYFAVSPGDLVVDSAESNNSRIEVSIATDGSYVRIDPAKGFRGEADARISISGTSEQITGGRANMQLYVYYYGSALTPLKLTPVAAKAPTYTAEGNIAHYVDEDGNLYLLPEYPYEAEETMTRAKIAQFIVTAFGWEPLPDGECDFTDVDASLPEYGAIVLLNEKGVISGYPDGTFRPDQILTKAEAARLLAWAILDIDANKLKPGSGLADVPADHWAAGCISFCTENGIMPADGEYFSPMNVLTFGDIDPAALMAWTGCRQVGEDEVILPALEQPAPSRPNFPSSVIPASGGETEEPEEPEEPDDTTATTVTGEDGSTATVWTDPEGTVTEAEAVITEEAIEAAGDGPVTLPLELTAAQDGAEAAPLTIVVPEDAGPVVVEIPVDEVDANSVVVLVHEDGTEEILPKAALTEDGLVIEVEGSVTVKIVDNAKEFDDVSDEFWGSEAIDFVTSRELFVGTGNDNFEPDLTMTRAMLVTVLYRRESRPESDGKSDFVDVAEGKWYSDAVAWASDNGIVQGYGDSFGKDDPVTREQLVVMLYRMAGEPEAEPVETGASDWAADAMSWAVSIGLIQGDGSGFNPQDTATRAETATILMRYING